MAPNRTKQLVNRKGLTFQQKRDDIWNSIAEKTQNCSETVKHGLINIVTKHPKFYTTAISSVFYILLEKICYDILELF